MLKNFLPGRAVVERLRAGLFGPHLDSFVAGLCELGYTSSTVRARLRLLDHLGRWLGRQSLGLADLQEQLVNRFLEERRHKGRLKKGDARAARHFLEYLRETDAVPSPELVADESPLATLRRQYENHLEKERGLAAVTITSYWRFIRRLLIERFGDAPLRVQELTPDDVSNYLLRHARSGSPKVARLMVTALRSFFRFLFLHGQTESDLAGAVPTVPEWRLAELPKYLASEEVERVVRACERDGSVARRDRAIILLLARLGLRASEVIDLEIDDVDWRAGELKVRGKGGHHDCLPLPVDVGAAMASYLRHHRPPCTTRRLFVRTKAPYRGFANPSSISTIVRRAMNRAGLHPDFKGAHVLRHSLATGMLRSGASLNEIGEVLRHRSPSTTEIYAKVDVQGLRSLALPWPTKGGQQ
ncbi:MAG: tyrosine-type recombinase/integrase [Chloroflexi bacterium]|nr:tyrosine-type recombinase/integrase [Chloroflexota bacterium]